MSNWIDATIIGLLTTLTIFLVYKLFRFRVLFKAISDMHLQTLADKALLEKKISELYQDIENQKLANSTGFIKFLSDSRDWAFQYIEEVQESLSEFDKEIVPILEWESTFGLVNGTNPHSDNMKRISEAYDKLKTVLPKETETPNN